MTEVVHTLEARRDTGMTNPRLGLWLFLASEAMLFGSLISAYLLLRLGAESWPSGRRDLDLAAGWAATLVLLGSSVLIQVATRRLKRDRPAAARLWTVAALALGVVFVVLELGTWRAELRGGIVPATSVRWASYFVLTGVHLLHLLGGILWLGALAVRSSPWRLDGSFRSRLGRQRLELGALYWHFVDGVWLILFALLYLW